MNLKCNANREMIIPYYWNAYSEFGTVKQNIIVIFFFLFSSFFGFLFGDVAATNEWRKKKTTTNEKTIRFKWNGYEAILSLFAKLYMCASSPWQILYIFNMIASSVVFFLPFQVLVLFFFLVFYFDCKNSYLLFEVMLLHREHNKWLDWIWFVFLLLLLLPVCIPFHRNHLEFLFYFISFLL